jgi:hypothetical protein
MAWFLEVVYLPTHPPTEALPLSILGLFPQPTLFLGVGKESFRSGAYKGGLGGKMNIEKQGVSPFTLRVAGGKR